MKTFQSVFITVLSTPRNKKCKKYYPFLFVNRICVQHLYMRIYCTINKICIPAFHLLHHSSVGINHIHVIPAFFIPAFLFQRFLFQRFYYSITHTHVLLQRKKNKKNRGALSDAPFIPTTILDTGDSISPASPRSPDGHQPGDPGDLKGYPPVRTGG